MNCKERLLVWSSTSKRLFTYSYKKVDHEKYVERQINLLGDVVAPLLTSFDILGRCINEVDDKRSDAEYEHEDDLQWKTVN